MKQIIAFILAFIMCLTLCACTTAGHSDPSAEELAEQRRLEEQKRLEEEEKVAAALKEQQYNYNKAFEALRENSYICPKGAEKVVTIYYDLNETYGTFVERFIPDDLKAETAEDARYLMKVTYRQEREGSYSGLGPTSSAWRRYYDVELIDLLYGETMKTVTFQGSAPPYSITAGNDGYGNYPTDEAVMEWVPGALEEGKLVIEEYVRHMSFQNTMSVLGEEGYVCTPSAEKAIAWIEERTEGEWVGTYCQTYIPEALLTEAPEEVRYIVKIRYVAEAVGMYYGIESHTAYELCYEAAILDLTDGSIVAERDFQGGSAPDQYNDWTKGVGSAPSGAAIEQWIAESIGA